MPELLLLRSAGIGQYVVVENDMGKFIDVDVSPDGIE